MNHLAKLSRKYAHAVAWLRHTTMHTQAGRYVIGVFRTLGSQRRELILITVLLAISLIAHSWNMLHFPYIENDEATYTSRAWTFITSGQLDVYTYRYDHAPLGWMLLGAWQAITGGAAMFGSLITSGRVFMLVIHLASTVLVYVLAKRFSGGSKLAAVVAVLFFALSPIAIYFQRRILLDNIMTFWLLLSLFFATQPLQRLKNYLLSAAFFGIAVLTKLNAVFFAPAILLFVWARSHRNHRLHASMYWALVAGMVILSFFVFALLKGELFAAPIGPDGNPTHVSVVETFTLQLGRGDFAWPWDTSSSFWQNILSWQLKDWALLPVGVTATFIVAFAAIRQKSQRMHLALLVGLIALYAAFLARGKIVLDLYIVPLIPLLAIVIGAAAGVTFKYIGQLRYRRLLKAVFVGVLFTSMGVLFTLLPTKQYTANETTNQLQAINWIDRHVPKDAVIATDNYVYPYLAQERGYTQVSYFFSTEYDPEIRKTYNNDWRDIEYLVLSHEIVKQIKTGTVPRMQEVLAHAELVADYRNGTSSYIDLPNHISTNGDWVQVYKIKDRNNIVLQDSWQTFKNDFIVDYGQVIDPQNNNLTTSRSQAQAMVRALHENDQAMFGGLWQWSKDHLRYRANDKLLSWQWKKEADGSYKLGDSNTVCDADQLIGYALYQADAKWPGKGYGQEASVHMQDWWRECTFEQNGKRYIDSSADGSQEPRLINTGYFRPAIYGYMKTKLPQLNWDGLINDNYELLDKVYAQYQTMPDWTVLASDGSLQTAAVLVRADADQLGDDALQLVPNLTEHFIATKDARALSLVNKLHPKVTAVASSTKRPSAQTSLLLIDQINASSTRQGITSSYQTVIYAPYKPQEGRWGQGYYSDQVWYWQWHDLQNSLPAAAQPEFK